MRSAPKVLRPADRRAAQRWLGRIEPDAEGHFVWPGYVDRFGYGRIIVEVRGVRVQWNAHQLVWAALIGPVPPAYLREAVDPQRSINVRGHCDGGRQLRICRWWSHLFKMR
jgi:hypothetical protein